MGEWLIDTNVLIDVIGADPIYGKRSLNTLTQLSETGILIINPVIYAEISAVLDSIEEIDELFSPVLFRRETLPWEACFLAGQSFRRYRKNQGKRKRMLADFLIGAHAAVSGFGLVSRDQGYAHYFNINLIDPSQSQT
ncbi:MAG: type II toxin-antitoxin system VapC family toxin [Pseudomonadota bacterium]